MYKWCARVGWVGGGLEVISVICFFHVAMYRFRFTGGDIASTICQAAEQCAMQSPALLSHHLLITAAELQEKRNQQGTTIPSLFGWHSHIITFLWLFTIFDIKNILLCKLNYNGMKMTEEATLQQTKIWIRLVQWNYVKQPRLGQLLVEVKIQVSGLWIATGVHKDIVDQWQKRHAWGPGEEILCYYEPHTMLVWYGVILESTNGARTM